MEKSFRGNCFIKTEKEVNSGFHQNAHSVKHFIPFLCLRLRLFHNRELV